MKISLQATRPAAFLVFFILLFSLFALDACGHRKKKTPVDTNMMDEEGAADSANCITMTRNQVKSWLHAGWSTQGSEYFVPDLYMTAAVDTTIRVDGYPTNADTAVQYSERIPYTIKSMNPPCHFPAGLTINPQYYDFSQQGYADAYGNLIPFDYMRLIPRTFSGDSTLMSFDVQIVYRGVVTAKGESRPCPPNCP